MPSHQGSLLIPATRVFEKCQDEDPLHIMPSWSATARGPFGRRQLLNRSLQTGSHALRSRDVAQFDTTDVDAVVCSGFQEFVKLYRRTPVAGLLTPPTIHRARRNNPTIDGPSGLLTAIQGNHAIAERLCRSELGEKGPRTPRPKVRQG